MDALDFNFYPGWALIESNGITRWKAGDASDLSTRATSGYS